ncbi:N-acetyl-gamma-glutamyl-phosphate reductase [Pontibacter sp. G13]|uniref:N-acetyl-gamma-glutamyl-phosphate reductase n=1 Tax=Pontibacter sp. G13 TaxID=3074898 RepID=UPI00288A0229|nr:N-acetyl-gamma-glutamyl-phosphate reductase [Pontibacter sp. G13]WNJ16353.1 N-acetyl-gamma-glutamyl-phosphate reductase [Pontibacter sp. G13]
MSIQIGIVGGAGYTAGELLRLLIHHPEANIRFVHSTSNAGNPISAVHTDLVGETDLHFTDEVDTEIDVLFVCAGHGKTKPFLEAHDLPASLKVIDLSRDFRLKEPGNAFVYGLPELNREEIRKTQFLANPGCFATCIQLGLLPLAAAGKLNDEVHVHAITGSTGAGQKPMATTHFSWRNNNLSVYKAFSHQHLGEIVQSLTQLQAGFEHSVNFLPMRGDFARGIYASLYLKSDLSEEDAVQLYEDFYADHPFTHVTAENPHLKQVVNTNKGLVHVEKHGDKLLILSMIDNLLKGASGQAVQNMNLMFGLPETLGLHLKAMAF